MKMIIPHDFESWRRCIEVDCGIALTDVFVNRRIAIYADAQHAETQRFITRYGAEHHRQVLQWFRTVAEQDDLKKEEKR